MTVITITLSLWTKIFLMVVSSDVVNGSCQPASRDYQMRQGNTLAFYPSLMQDHTLKDTIYHVRKASSDVVCAVHCLQDESCKSFNYCNGKVCQLKAANNTVTKASAIQLTDGCRHYGDEELQTEETTIEGTSLCAQNTHRFKGNWELQVPMTSPMRLAFTVHMESFVDVHFSLDVSGTREKMYLVELGSQVGRFFKWDPSSQTMKFQKGIAGNSIGVPVIITYDNGRFELTIRGSTVAYDEVSAPQPSWFVSFGTFPEAEFIFTEPCINDFNPQFIS
ncbi:uncharacterized protein [Asterias amurensis]|uniref:uncharacterized protein n=1 Tax=Asterias amurensis TaxID=7602 RepID=UPI003AB1DC07